MRFEFFRFLLTSVEQPELPLHGKFTREEVIAKIFSTNKRYNFKSKKATYVLVIPFCEEKLAFGRIGKRTSKLLHDSPDKGFKEKREEDWPGSHIFINLSDEKLSGNTKKSGQMIALQVNMDAISDSTNCLRALAIQINKEISSSGFRVSINPVLKERQKFWNVIDKNRGSIKKVVLTYTPPNIFNLENKLEDDLRAANKKFNTTSTQIVLENDDGDLNLPKGDALLDQSAEYIDLGNGNFRVHLTSGKKIIKSEDGVRTEEFEGDSLAIEGAGNKEIKEIIKNFWEKNCG